MTSKLFRFFRKSASTKENEHYPTELERDISYRQSARSSRQSGRGERTTRFNCDEKISPTAPYHTVTAPKLTKGPQSCPGGYRDRDDHHRHEDLNRSLENEFHHNKRRSKHEVRDKYRRSIRDTSEYGSGDPSPIGNHARHMQYMSDVMGDSDTEEYEYSMKVAQMEEACQRFKEKLRKSEERHIYYKNQCRELRKEKDDMQRTFFNQIRASSKETERMAEHIQNLEQQLMHYRMPYGANNNTLMGNMVNTRRFMSPHQDFYSFGMPNNNNQQQQAMSCNRMSLGGPQLSSMPGNTSTPSTALAASFSGAGEALTEESDLSCLQPLESSFSSRQTAEGVDETKDFRGDSSFETPRAATMDTSTESIFDRTDVTPTLKQYKDDDDEDSNNTVVIHKVAEKRKVRRVASDGDLRQTTL